MQPTTDDSQHGWKNLFLKLDLVFKEEENDELYMHYTRLNNLRRVDNGLSMVDFIVEFEQLYDKVSEGIENIPDPLIAFILLDGAQLSDAEKKMAFTFCKDITFVNMKSALKRLFSNSVGCGNRDGAMCSSNTNVFSNSFRLHEYIKQEAFYSANRSKWDKKDKPFSQSSSSSNSHYKQRHNKVKPVPGKNPIGKDGERTWCKTCRSVNHWASECPDKELLFNRNDRSVHYNKNVDHYDDDSSDNDMQNEVISYNFARFS